MIIVALLIGVMVGFASGWEMSSLQHRQGGKLLVTPPAPTPAPSPMGEPEPVAVTYRAVVDEVGANSLHVTVMEGAAGSPELELIPGADAMLVALKPAPQEAQGAAETAKGLPPPPQPTGDGYVAQPMALEQFRVGDVVEFSSAEAVADGGSLMVGKIAWIMNLQDRAQQPGPREGGTAPLKPKR